MLEAPTGDARHVVGRCSLRLSPAPPWRQPGLVPAGDLQDFLDPPTCLAAIRACPGVPHRPFNRRSVDRSAGHAARRAAHTMAASWCNRVALLETGAAADAPDSGRRLHRSWVVDTMTDIGCGEPLT